MEFMSSMSWAVLFEAGGAVGMLGFGLLRASWPETVLLNSMKP